MLTDSCATDSRVYGLVDICAGCVSLCLWSSDFFYPFCLLFVTLQWNLPFR